MAVLLVSAFTLGRRFGRSSPEYGHFYMSWPVAVEEAGGCREQYGQYCPLSVEPIIHMGPRCYTIAYQALLIALQDAPTCTDAESVIQ